MSAAASTDTRWWRELGSVLPRSAVYAAAAARLPGGDDPLPRLSPNPLAWASIALDDDFNDVRASRRFVVEALATCGVAERARCDS